MKSCVVITLIILLLAPAFIYAQEKNTKIAVQFLSNENISQVNLDEEQFLSYAKLFTDKLSNSFSAYTQKQDVMVLFTLHKNKPATISTYAKPALTSKEEKKLSEELNAIPSPFTRFADFSIVYDVAINGGNPDKNATFVPEFHTPDELEKAKFEQLGWEVQYAAIKVWSANEVIPILAGLERAVDAKFAGVRAVGDLFQKTNFNNTQNINELTDKNTNYWRAVIEMAKGDQIIPVSKIFMHASQGELDYAGLYIQLISSFSDPKTVSNYYLNELKWRMGSFNKKMNAEISKGLDLHDKGNYKQAAAYYDKLLKVYPHSAWANYERYFSQNADNLETKKENKEDRAFWDASKGAIYAANPMYPMDVRASNGKEGYLLVRRQSLATLFGKGNDFKQSYITYSDIALELEAYGVAAQMNWIILSNISDKEYGDKNIPAYFLYCLDKLGEKELKTDFKGDFVTEFKKIDEKLHDDMVNSTIYKSFKN